MDQSFGLFPAQAGIGDRFSVAVPVYVLGAIFDVTLDHQALDQFFDLRRISAAVHDVFADIDLFERVFSRI